MPHERFLQVRTGRTPGAGDNAVVRRGDEASPTFVELCSDLRRACAGGVLFDERFDVGGIGRDNLAELQVWGKPARSIQQRVYVFLRVAALPLAVRSDRELAPHHVRAE